MTLKIPDWLAAAGVSTAIPSTGYTKANGRTVRVIVLHYAVTAETPSAAEGVANYFRSGVKASSHFTTDNDSTVYQVDVDDVAWAAPGANHDGIQIEQAGTVQTREQWLDPYSTAMLDRTARLVVALAAHYDIPLAWLTDAQLGAGQKGIVDHWAVTRVYPGPGRNHTDLGTGFPRDYFMDRVHHFADNPSEEDPMAGINIDTLVQKIRNAVLFDNVIQIIGRDKGEKMSVATALRVLYDDVKSGQDEIAGLKEALAQVAARQSEGNPVTADEVRQIISQAATTEAQKRLANAKVVLSDEAAAPPDEPAPPVELGVGSTP